jgi:uncharacterized membrane protein
VAPVLGALLAALAAAAALTLDHFIDWRDAPVPVFVGEADTARMLLSVIGGAVSTLLALIFTVIAVAIQLAIGHYTPRALAILLGDRPTHFTIGVFVGTFTYALIVLLCLRVTSDGGMVSGLSMTIAFGLAIVTIATFAVYSNHIIHSVRATSLIHRIAQETRASIDSVYPRLADDQLEPESLPVSPAAPPGQIVPAPCPGILVDVDEQALLRLAVEADCLLVIQPPVGAFLPEGAPLLAVYDGEIDAASALAALELDNERNMRLDASFGLRQLVDIAARSLSSGINDPATAVQVIDELHDLLRRLVQRRLVDGSCCDRQGKLRVVLRMVDWDEIVALTLDELRRFGSGSMSVSRRLRALLEDLLALAPPCRRASLQQQLTLLDEAVDRAFATDFERRLARQRDVRGVGF